MARKTVGIRDVAAAAGVSVTTVSHVLNDTPPAPASDETRKKVRDAATSLGYGPNRMAQGLRTQRSAMIGHAVFPGMVTESGDLVVIAVCRGWR